MNIATRLSAWAAGTLGDALLRHRSIGLAPLLLLAAASSHASVFAILEQSGSSLGTAYSGTAVTAADASTIFFNPAGLLEIDRSEATIVASSIDLKTRFRDRASSAAVGQSLGSGGGDAGGFNLIPSVYAALRWSDDWRVGIGINAPFGLQTEYESEWLGRFQAVKSEIRTLNFNPTLAYRINQAFSVGLGVDYQRVDSELTNAVNLSAVVAQGLSQTVAAGLVPESIAPAVLQASQGLEGTAVVRGDDGAFGYNLGVRWELSPATQLGLSYRSTVDYDVHGTVRFVLPVSSDPIAAAILTRVSAEGSPLAPGPVSVQLKLPDSAILSVSQALGEKTRLLADLGWTRWSTVQELRVVRESGTTLSVMPQRWDDTLRFSLGATYQLRPSLMLRGGLMFDQTPVPDSTRGPRLADADRTLIALGIRWSPAAAAIIDVGFAHLFSPEARVNQDNGNPAASGTLVGRQASSANIAALQLVYRFD